MELERRTWSAALRLAIVISVVAVIVAAAINAAGEVPQAAIVLPIIAIAFTASWVQTGRVRRDLAPVRRSVPHQRSAA